MQKTGSAPQTNGYATIADVLAKFGRKSEDVDIEGVRFRMQMVSDREFRTLRENAEDNELWVRTVVISPELTDFEQLDGSFVFKLAEACRTFVLAQYEEEAGKN